MQLKGKALRVIVYVGESDRYQGKALYMALLAFLKREGASGATVVRGLAGFGARSRIHTATILSLSEDLPLRVEWVDQRQTVERLMPQIRQMVDAGLITVEEVDVVQYAPGRQADPLTILVADVMRREVLAVPAEMAAGEIVKLLLERGVRSLPVVGDQERLIGIITNGDLLRRTGLQIRLDLQDPDSLSGQLANLSKSAITAGEIMTQPVISLLETATLRMAIGKMIDNNLKRLPVIDETGRLTGWISRVDVLRTLEYHQRQEGKKAASTERVSSEQSLPSVKDPGRGATVAELMRRDAPTLDPSAPLGAILTALERSRHRRAVVIDQDRRVLGIITDGDLFRRSHSADHPGLIDRLQRLVSGQPPDSYQSPPDAGETAADLMTTPAISIALETPLGEALRLMLDHQVKRLPVVDGEGRFVGLLGREGLLLGLMADADDKR